MHRLTPASPALAALVVLITAAAVLVGAPLWLLIAGVTIPCAVVLWGRVGGPVAFGALLLGGLWLLLVLLVAIAAIRLPLLATAVVVLAIVGLAACIVWWRGGRPPAVRLAVAVVLPACVGSAAWLVSSISIALLRPVAGVAWAMHGDAASYLLYARTVLSDGGIVLGPRSNPVPLPAALFALFAAPGRSGVSAANLLRHDLVAYESLQILVIAVCCLCAGLLAGRIARLVAVGRLVPVIASVAGSVLPLSWVLTTYTLTYGYFDAELVLPVVLGSIAVAFSSRGRPIITVVLLFVSCTVVLAVWSPLVVVPGGLLVFTLVRDRRVILGLRGRRRVVPLFAVAQLLAWALLVTLPSVLAQGHFLTAGGAIYSFTHSLFPSLALITVLLAIVALRVARVADAGVAMVVALCLAVGLVLLLWVNRNVPGVWSYFPLKFEWLAVAVLLVLMMGLLPAVVLPWVVRRTLRFAVAVALVSMAAIVGLTSPLPTNGNPLVWIAQGPTTSDGGAAVASNILVSGDLSKPVVYWQSAVPNEQYLNYWLIELASRSMANNPLRKFAFHYNENGVRDLCSIIERTPGTVTVRTRNGGLASTIAASCADRAVHVVLLPGRPGT